MKICSFDIEHLKAHVRLTQFGERMWFSIAMPAHSFNPSVQTYFDPGDGHPVELRINILNSVDTTASFEIKIVWIRLVCSNGMIFGEKIDFKEIHLTKKLSINAIETFLQTQFEKEQFKTEIERFQRWFKAKVKIVKELSETKPSQGQIEQWLEKHVTKRWDVNAAARVYHIAKTGKDCKFRNDTGKKHVKFNDLNTYANIYFQYTWQQRASAKCLRY